MTNTQTETRLQERIYDSLVAFNKTAHTPELRLAQMRQHLAEHLTRDLLSYCRAENLREAIEAARTEYLTGSTGTAEDTAYNDGVADAIAAIGALLEGGK
ncbi:hypothetical protein [Streptomyces sp. MZ04]|uniref:hypothetical protein n=1 Tax=Streptomyces sp. MZ04 TaxID=2559236 RepID=UPI00107EB8D2|nr:hypothetical protein [Streptomyces sp. MZ04]TGB13825.1 hypothetical protein E2651_07730 [Streptomyces sp. MZ04]